MYLSHINKTIKNIKISNKLTEKDRRPYQTLPKNRCLDSMKLYPLAGDEESSICSASDTYMEHALRSALFQLRCATGSERRVLKKTCKLSADPKTLFFQSRQLRLKHENAVYEQKTGRWEFALPRHARCDRMPPLAVGSARECMALVLAVRMD